MINVSVELDWDAARKHVNEHMQSDVQAHQEGLQKYLDERGMDEVKQYLPTDYFDACGFRHWHLEEDASYDTQTVIVAMKKIMVANAAQANIFGEIEANNAFEEWKVGNHDT